jgi:hypothetical protein
LQDFGPPGGREAGRNTPFDFSETLDRCRGLDRIPVVTEEVTQANDR